MTFPMVDPISGRKLLARCFPNGRLPSHQPAQKVLSQAHIYRRFYPTQWSRFFHDTGHFNAILFDTMLTFTVLEVPIQF